VFFLFTQPKQQLEREEEVYTADGYVEQRASDWVSKWAVLKGARLLAHHAQPRRHVVRGELMAAARANWSVVRTVRKQCPQLAAS